MSLSVFAEPLTPFKSRAQYAVLQTLRIKKILTVVGFSMVGQQVRWMLVFSACRFLTCYLKAYYWLVMYSDYVEK